MKKIFIEILFGLFISSIFIIGNSVDLYAICGVEGEPPCATSTISTQNPPSSTTSSAGSDNILGKSTVDLRTGNITMADIPLMIASAIEYILGVAGSICVVALIYHALRMQFASGITGDSSGVDKAKKGMKGALLGFVLAMSAWFLMTKLVALLASTTGG